MPVSLIFFLFIGKSVQAQFPEPTPEHEVLKQDVGIWQASVKLWMGADGKTDPNADPTVSQGVETNRLLGPFWVISEFKGDFGGLPFEGHSISGYDTKTKKYVGSWVDSVSPAAMHMSGTFDKSTNTLTSSTKGIDLEGNEVQGKSVVKYVDKDHRLMTMYELKAGTTDQYVRSMEIVYLRQK
ncbi:MAG: DUF1579 domain-containing protein [Planctomycetales bacterium]|nr:DUF1579 domain-containing protein [Planctomycetales bacterium]